MKWRQRYRARQRRKALFGRGPLNIWPSDPKGRRTETLVVKVHITRALIQGAEEDAKLAGLLADSVRDVTHRMLRKSLVPDGS